MVCERFPISGSADGRRDGGVQKSATRRLRCGSLYIFTIDELGSLIKSVMTIPVGCPQDLGIGGYPALRCSGLGIRLDCQD